MIYSKSVSSNGKIVYKTHSDLVRYQIVKTINCRGVSWCVTTYTLTATDKISGTVYIHDSFVTLEEAQDTVQSFENYINS